MAQRFAVWFLLGCSVIGCAGDRRRGEASEPVWPAPGPGDDAGDVGTDAPEWSPPTDRPNNGPLIPTTLDCAVNPQDILILDFRSGWWSGGGGGEFYRTILDRLRRVCDNVTLEYHHFEMFGRVECLYPPAGEPRCEMLMMGFNVTPEQVVGFFEKPRWDDYTQVWILSGSEMDPSDVAISGDLFQHFIDQTGTSCVPFFIGAGDGFIDHGNALGAALGIGEVMSTDLGTPTFFEYDGGSVSSVSRMGAGAELTSHLLFTGVGSVADEVTDGDKEVRGDALVDNPGVEVIARDTRGRPVIGVGAVDLASGDGRPFILDAGLQRYYTVEDDADTLTLLGNIMRYLGRVGCRALIQ